MSSAICFTLDQSKILLFGKEIIDCKAFQLQCGQNIYPCFPWVTVTCTLHSKYTFQALAAFPHSSLRQMCHLAMAVFYVSAVQVF